MPVAVGEQALVSLQWRRAHVASAVTELIAAGGLEDGREIACWRKGESSIHGRADLRRNVKTWYWSKLKCALSLEGKGMMNKKKKKKWNISSDRG